MSKIQMNLVEQSDKAVLYTITIEGESLSEFEKFIEKFKNHSKLQEDYRRIIYALHAIMLRGVKERYFRPEGKYADGVCALPIESGKLRLYCLRLTDSILVAGNGGVKSTARYEDDEELNGYVISLQQFEKILRIAIKRKDVTIEEMEIGIDEKIFLL